MVQFNFAERTIKAKVVYYGPAQSGKTTNLEHIHRLTDPAGNNRLISLNTAQDRTLFFDLLPFSLGAISGYDFKVQTEQVVKNILAVLKEAKMGPENVVKASVFLADLADFPQMNEVYGKYFGKEPPARSTIQAAALPKGARIEIDVIAAF